MLRPRTPIHRERIIGRPFAARRRGFNWREFRRGAGLGVTCILWAWVLGQALSVVF